MRKILLLAFVIVGCNQYPAWVDDCGVRDVQRFDSLFKSCMSGGGVSAGLISGDGVQSPYACRTIVTSVVQTCNRRLYWTNGNGEHGFCDSAKSELAKEYCSKKPANQE
jgi:hypothetical protein